MWHKINKTCLPASRPVPELLKTRLKHHELELYTYMFIISMVKNNKDFSIAELCAWYFIHILIFSLPYLWSICKHVHHTDKKKLLVIYIGYLTSKTIK